MKTYTITEVEKEDWDELKMMTTEEAIEILGDPDHTYLRGYLGSYNYGSTDDYDYRKAKIYYAINKLVEVAKLSK